MKLITLFPLALLPLCQGRRLDRTLKSLEPIQEKPMLNAKMNTPMLTETELAPEKVGEPDRGESSWLFWKVMHAQHLPFHHFLDLHPGRILKRRNHSKDMNEPVHPVVLVGGLMSSYLVANLTKNSSKYWYCPKHATNVHLWLDVSKFLPFVAKCWMENMKLSWNIEEEQYEDNGVHVDTEHFGDLDGFTFYMWDLVYAALQPLGYGRKSVRGAQYDWRYGPAEWRSTGHFHKFKKLIEQTYEENQGRKVVPISISQGGQYVRNFLASDVVDAAWKDKYIKSWISLSGIFDGSPEGLATVLFPASSDVEGITSLPWIKANTFHEMAMSWSGAYAMIPPSSTDLGAPYIVTTPTKNYTLAQVKEAFVDAGLAIAASLYEHSGPDRFADAQLAPPGVDVHCWYGRGLKTVNGMHYGNGITQPPTGFSHADGDGSVIESSLAACRKWASRDPAHHVDVVVFPGLAHKDLCIHESPVAHLAGLLRMYNQGLSGAT